MYPTSGAAGDFLICIKPTVGVCQRDLILPLAMRSSMHAGRMVRFDGNPKIRRFPMANLAQFGGRSFCADLDSAQENAACIETPGHRVIAGLAGSLPA